MTVMQTARTGVNRAKVAIGLAAASLITATVSAEGFDPSAQIAEGATEIQDMAMDMAAEFWPVLIGIFVALAAMGLFKKFGRRAT